MINRLKELFGDPEQERPPASNYYVVDGGFEEFYVTRQTAMRLIRRLDAPARPRWIRFRDVWGSRVSLRGDRVGCVRECTEAQRASEREFHRARRRESKADRRWEEDEWW